MDGDAATDTGGSAVPVFKIDLSLPPAERYVELAKRYKGQARSLTRLFDELVVAINPRISLKFVHFMARLFLRRLYTSEETEEIRGISRITGIAMYLLVSFNVLLDSLMGCTSGGVKVKRGEQAKMLHFRTLDWGMDPLRSLVVQLEYVRSPEMDRVLATSVTYVGYVGILTGVAKNLSVSLNFRPVHDPRNNIPYCFNNLLVLLGLRQSISSLLRQCILSAPHQKAASRRNSQKDISVTQHELLRDVVARIPRTRTTAAYLVFSDGSSTITMEKDYRSAVVQASSSFIVVTNHDQQPESSSTESVAENQRHRRTGLGLIESELQSLADVIEDSNERRDCMQAKWDHKIRQARRVSRQEYNRRQKAEQQSVPVRRKSASAGTKRESDGRQEPQRSDNSGVETDVFILGEEDIFASQREVIQWLSEYPIVNETTHYAAIMDPLEGKVVWLRRYIEPRLGDEN